MSLTSRRTFLGAAAISAGCGAPAPRQGTSGRNRNHPLDGIPRPKIRITGVKVIPLSYVDPKKNLWRSANYIVWKTDGCITQIFTDQGLVGIGEGSPYEGPDYIHIVDHARFLRIEDNYVVFEVESGTYEFISQLPR